MTKKISLTGIVRIQVTINDYSHDTNGNLTAHYIVHSFSTDRQYAAPTGELAESKRRVQVGYGRDSEIISAALAKAGVPVNSLKEIERWGSRSEDCTKVLFEVTS